MEPVSSTSLRTDVKLQFDLEQVYFSEHGKYFLQFSLISDKAHLIEDVEKSSGQNSNVFSEVAYLERSRDRNLLFSRTIDFTARKTAMNFKNSFTYKFPKGVNTKELKNNTYLKAEAILFEKDKIVLKKLRKVAEVIIDLECIDKTIGKIRGIEFLSKNKKSTLGLMLYTACLYQQTIIENGGSNPLQLEHSIVEVVPSMSGSNLDSIEEQITSESSRDAWHGIRDERRRQRNQAILMEKHGPPQHIECEAANGRKRSDGDAVEIFECKVKMGDENEERQTKMEDEERENEVIGDDGERVIEEKCKARKDQSGAMTQKQQEEIPQQHGGASPCKKMKTNTCNDGDSEQQSEDDGIAQSNEEDGDGDEPQTSSTQVFITEVPNSGSATTEANENDGGNDNEGLVPAPVELRPSHSRLDLQQDLRDAGNLLEEGMASDSSLGDEEFARTGLELRSSRSQVNLTLGDTAADRQHQNRLRTIAEQERQRNGRRTSAADAYWNRMEVHFDATDQEVTISSVENVNHRINQAHLSDEGVDLNCSVYSRSDTNHSAGGNDAPHSSAGALQHGGGENHEETQTDKVLTFPLLHESNNVARLFLTHFHESQADDGAASHEGCLACQLRRLKFLNISTRNTKPMGTLQLFGEIEHGNESLVIGRYQLLSTADTACVNNHACGEQITLLKRVSSKKSQTPRSFMTRYNSRQESSANLRNLSASSLRLPITTSSPLKTRTVTFPQIEKLKKHGGEKRKGRPSLPAVTEKRRNCYDNRSIIRRNIQQVSARRDARKTQPTSFKTPTQVGKKATAKKTARPSTSAQSVESARAQVRREMQDYRRLLDDIKNGKRFNTAAAESRKKAVSESTAQRIGSNTKVEPKTRAKKSTEQNHTGWHGQRLKKIKTSETGVKPARKATTARINADPHPRSSCRASNLELGNPAASQNKHRTFGPPPSRSFKKAPAKFRKSFDRPRETRSSLDTGLFPRSKLPPTTKSLSNKALNKPSASPTTTAAVKRSCTATELRYSLYSARRKNDDKSISRLLVQDFHRTKLIEKVAAAKSSEPAPVARKSSSQRKVNNFTPVLPSIQEDN